MISEMNTEVDLLRIKSIAEEFTIQSIGTTIPKNMCFLTCYPLLLFLKIRGVDASLNRGEYNNDKYKKAHHYWLNLDEYKGIILDPTIRQFEENIEPVYIGKITHNYTLDIHPFNAWFSVTYNIWEKPLLDTHNIIPLPPEIKQKAILYNLKAAIVLNNEIEQMATGSKEKFMQWDLVMDYFSAINTFLINKLKNDVNFINDLKSVLSEGFNNLLSKAIDSKA